MRQVRAAISAAALVVFSVGFAGPAHADSAPPTDWQISSFHATLSAQNDGALQVHEEIVFDFGTSPGHGIIQYVTHPGLDAGGPAGTVTDVKVTSPDGAPADTAIDDSSGKTKITVGQATKTITGRHTYDVDFRVSNTVYADSANPGTAALMWPIIDDWAVPISDIEVTLTMPGKLTADQCWAGPIGTEAHCDSQSMNGTTLTLKQAHLAAGQQLTERASSALNAAATTLPTASAAQYPLTAPSTASGDLYPLDGPVQNPYAADNPPASSSSDGSSSHAGAFILIALLAGVLGVVAFVRRIGGGSGGGGGGGGNYSGRRYNDTTWTNTSYTDSGSSWTDTSSSSGGFDSGGFSGGDSGQSGGW